jgi:diadenosine tetraphosphatase ApaH/serine/threonine PP2A family protein phosphatase
MRAALLFDIHANLPALEAVLAEVERAVVDEVLHGGDLVGWGPQPNEVVAVVAEGGITGVVGNHELLCLGAFTEEHPLRNQSTAWTTSVLSEEARRSIGELPAQKAYDDFLLSHADPAAWHEPPDNGCFPYVGPAEPGDTVPVRQRRELGHVPGFRGGVIVTGHTHVPAVYAAHLGGAAIEMREMEAGDSFLECSLGAGEWLYVTVGAVGKPRDGVPAANWALVDSEAGTITLRRVSYDVQAVCEMIRRTEGLPDVLAEELAKGR